MWPFRSCAWYSLQSFWHLPPVLQCSNMLRNWSKRSTPSKTKGTMSVVLCGQGRGYWRDPPANSLHNYMERKIHILNGKTNVISTGQFSIANCQNYQNVGDLLNKCRLIWRLWEFALNKKTLPLPQLQPVWRPIIIPKQNPKSPSVSIIKQSDDLHDFGRFQVTDHSSTSGVIQGLLENPRTHWMEVSSYENHISQWSMFHCHVGLAQNYGTNDPQKWSCLAGKPIHFGGW